MCKYMYELMNVILVSSLMCEIVCFKYIRAIQRVSEKGKCIGMWKGYLGKVLLLVGSH